jgi:hypothetical protein
LLHVHANPDVIAIGYAWKSPTKENDVSQSHLLQLMVGKLHFRQKCQEVYISPCCVANDLILRQDSPSLQTILILLKACQGDIADLTNQLYYLRQEVRFGIIDYADLIDIPEDIIDFLTTYPNIFNL